MHFRVLLITKNGLALQKLWGLVVPKNLDNELGRFYRVGIDWTVNPPLATFRKADV